MQTSACSWLDSVGCLAIPFNLVASICWTIVSSFVSVADFWLFGHKDLIVHFWNRDSPGYQTRAEFLMIIKMILALVLLSVLTDEESHASTPEVSAQCSYLIAVYCLQFADLLLLQLSVHKILPQQRVRGASIYLGKAAYLVCEAVLCLTACSILNSLLEGTGPLQRPQLVVIFVLVADSAVSDVIFIIEHVVIPMLVLLAHDTKAHKRLWRDVQTWLSGALGYAR